MDDRSEYWVAITEISKKYVAVEATTPEKAEQVARKNWEDSEYLFDENDFLGIVVEALLNDKDDYDLMDDYDYRCARIKSERIL